MFHYTYVLLSLKDRRFYVGYTDNLRARLKKHQDGKVSSTKDRLPLKLVYFEAGLSKKKAISREKQLKTGFGRAYVKRRI